MANGKNLDDLLKAKEDLETLISELSSENNPSDSQEERLEELEKELDEINELLSKV